jgi:hypothetical protein
MRIVVFMNINLSSKDHSDCCLYDKNIKKSWFLWLKYLWSNVLYRLATPSWSGTGEWNHLHTEDTRFTIKRQKIIYIPYHKISSTKHPQFKERDSPKTIWKKKRRRNWPKIMNNNPVICQRSHFNSQKLRYANPYFFGGRELNSGANFVEVMSWLSQSLTVNDIDKPN